ncbi:MAG: TolC family protein [Gemmataceae bacterium]|nr:TolC family protein [Gemmataceae bacterium]MDW8265976.1 hypothetical protein [Gemmataceae bacterium]
MLPLVERGRIVANLAGLPSYPELALALAEQNRMSPPYRALTEFECQCLAVDASAEAERYRQEVRVLDRTTRTLWCDCSRKARVARLKQMLLTAMAEEYQNRSAAAALELFFRIAEAEGRWDLSMAGQALVDDTLTRLRRIREQGLKPPVSVESIERQKLDVQAQAVKLRVGIDQANDHLRRLLRLDPCIGGERLWPVADFAVTIDPPDVDSAVADGLAHRPELVALRRLVVELDVQTLAAARNVWLAGSGGLLGPEESHSEARTWLLSVMALVCGDPPEVEIRRQQLCAYLREREEMIANEIRQSARSMQAQGQLVVLAQERVRHWQERVKEVERQAERGLASFVDLAAVKTEWLNAQGELVKEVMAWHAARTLHKQSRHLLLRECRGVTSALGPAITAAETAPCASLP